VLWGQRWASLRWAAIVACLYAAAPPVWMNVAWWGQVDALLMLPLALAILMLGQAQGRWSWLCWALALLIKAQAIIFAPLLVIVTLRRYGSRGIVQGVLIAGAVVVLGCVPLLIAGQGFPLADAYLGSVGRFPRTTYGAYNLWHLVLGGAVTEDHNLFVWPLSYRSAGLVLLGGAVGAIGIALWRDSGAQGRVRAAALLALSFFLLPTQIHERYLFLSLPLLALWATYERRLTGALVWYSIAAALNIVLILSGFWPAAKDVLEGYPQLMLAISAINLSLFGLLLLRAVWPPAQGLRRGAGISSSPRAPYQSE
jgi:Gpi18-like mannosyltransferase